MYVVIATGGKQYRVTEGSTLQLEKLEGEVGDTINFDQVLMAVDGDNIQLGTPLVSGGQVSATVVRHARDDKIKIVKHRRRKNSRRQMGHRQHFTEVRIETIQFPGQAAQAANTTKSKKVESSTHKPKETDAAKLQAAPKARKSAADSEE